MKILRKFPYWWLLAIPALLFSLGVASNQAVLIANHGKFPVMFNEVQIEKNCSAQGIDPELLESIPPDACVRGGQYLDEYHTIMGPNSHLKALADIIPLGDAVYSIGDGFIFLGVWLLSFTPLAWFFLTVRKLASLVN